VTTAPDLFAEPEAPAVEVPLVERVYEVIAADPYGRATVEIARHLSTSKAALREPIEQLVAEGRVGRAPWHFQDPDEPNAKPAVVWRIAKN